MSQTLAGFTVSLPASWPDDTQHYDTPMALRLLKSPSRKYANQIFGLSKKMEKQKPNNDITAYFLSIFCIFLTVYLKSLSMKR